MIYKFLKPKYVDEFVCVGPDCEFTCCQNWRIDIDEKTIKKYQKIKDPIWKEKFANYIDKPESKNKYHTIKLNDEKKCSFLTIEGLCSIQKTFGEELLGDVCATFPRESLKIASNKIEQSCSLTCPEVIKLVILSEQPLEFIESNKKFVDVDKIIFLSALNRKHAYIKDYNYVKNFIVSTLKNNDFNIQDRLLILVYAFESFKDENSKLDIKQHICLLEQLIVDNSIGAVLKQIKPNHKEYFKFMKDIISNIFQYSKDELFQKYCYGFYNSLGLNLENENYFFSLYDEYYRLFLQKNPLILENYLVHASLQTLFPYKSNSFWNDMMSMIVRYTIVNFFFMGLVVDGKIKLNETSFLKCFSIMSRALDSTKPEFCLEIVKGMDKKNINTLSQAFTLIKV